MFALNDSKWNKIKDILPGKQSDPGRTGADNRRFVEAIMWVGRNGSRWRALPGEYGNWNSVHRRFRRWSKKGIWQTIFNTLVVSADTEWLMIDSTIIRAHQHAAGAKGGSKTKPWDAVEVASPPKSTRLATATATRCASSSPQGRHRIANKH